VKSLLMCLLGVLGVGVTMVVMRAEVWYYVWEGVAVILSAGVGAIWLWRGRKMFKWKVDNITIANLYLLLGAFASGIIAGHSHGLVHGMSYVFTLVCAISALLLIAFWLLLSLRKDRVGLRKEK
jgi:hypothetical protein